MNRFSFPRVLLVGLGLFLLSAAAQARKDAEFEVTITNLTRGQSFTPQLVAIHHPSVSLFEVGQPASDGLALLAEAGDTSGVAGELLAQGRAVGDVQTIPGLIGPGESASITVSGGFVHRVLSVAAMLVPTNDTFVAVNGVALPNYRETVVTALAYDAGSEANDQNCRNIPGPRCGGEGFSPGPNEGDEGFVYVSNGFHELTGSEAQDGEVLGPLVYDWRNPVARITVKRLR